MKLKIVLLLITAIGSTALFASAQQPAVYTITTRQSADSQDVGAQPVPKPVPPPPPSVVSSDVPLNPALRMITHGIPQQYVTTYTVGENGANSQAYQLAQQLAAAKSDSEREKTKGQLAEVLEKQFDQRQKRHEEEIKQLEEQLKKLKNLVDKRQENRHQIIGDRLNQIVRDSQGLGW
jgi:flagellar motility protein MotE (MotC chaperone)